jgi:hypothetical protein
MADGIVVRILGDDSDLRGTLNDSVKDVAKWGAAAAAAAAVGAVAITKSTADAAREIKNLSNLIGTSTTEFQRMAAGAKTVGIEQDKLADIFKDVNDKIGDFMQTGAGPLVDFFEQVAPKIGVTADEFKNLSGPEALQKYVTGLEAANLSQAEMTFFMEAIASDAALLTPLLRDNGKGFKEMGDQAERAGAVLSDIDIAKLGQLDKELVKGQLAIKGLTNQLSAKLAPQLVAIIDQMDKFSEKGGGLGEALDTAFSGAVTAIGFVGNSMRGLEVIVKAIEVAFEGLGVGVGIFATVLVEQIDLAVQGAMNSVNLLIDGINTIPGIELDKIVVGKSNIAESMRETLDEAKVGLSETVTELHDLMNTPLPSLVFEKLIEANEEAALKLAEDTVVANELKNEAQIVQIDTELMAESEKFARLLELEQAYQESQTEGLDSFNANNLKTAKDYAKATEKLEEASNKRKLSMASSAFGNLSSLMDTENRKLFEIGKVAALSQAIIDGYSSVLSSYKAGSDIGGPIVGAAFAATAGIATAVQISKISGASFGGGGSGGGGMAAGGSPNIPEPQAAAAPAASQDRNLVVSGFDSSTLITGDMLNGILEGINDAVEDGFVLRVG